MPPRACLVISLARLASAGSATRPRLRPRTRASRHPPFREQKVQSPLSSRGTARRPSTTRRSYTARSRCRCLPQWRIAGAQRPIGARRTSLLATAAASARYKTNYPLRIKFNPVLYVHPETWTWLFTVFVCEWTASSFKCYNLSKKLKNGYENATNRIVDSNDSRWARRESVSRASRRRRSREWGRQYRVNRRSVRSLLRRRLWFFSVAPDNPS